MNENRIEKKMSRQKLEEEFVNLYRLAWGTNEGLSIQKIKSMTPNQLKQSIRSLQDFNKLIRVKP